MNLGLDFYRTHKVSDATYNAAVEQFGVHGLTNLVNLMAYYALLAFNANTFPDRPSRRPDRDRVAHLGFPYQATSF